MKKPPLWLPPTTDKPLEVSLIVGSFKYTPIKHTLFKLTLPKSQPPPTHPDEPSFHPLPEITHTFRPGERIPPSFISGIFAVATLAPWVVLLGLVSSLFIFDSIILYPNSGLRFLTEPQNCIHIRFCPSLCS